MNESERKAAIEKYHAEDAARCKEISLNNAVPYASLTRGCEGQCQAPRPIASCDQEAWVMQRVRTAIDMTLALDAVRRVRAEDGMFERAKNGIIMGAAEEIIETLGYEPEYVNIKKGTV